MGARNHCSSAVGNQYGFIITQELWLAAHAHLNIGSFGAVPWDDAHVEGDVGVPAPMFPPLLQFVNVANLGDDGEQNLEDEVLAGQNILAGWAGASNIPSSR